MVKLTVLASLLMELFNVLIIKCDAVTSKFSVEANLLLTGACPGIRKSPPNNLNEIGTETVTVY